MGAVLTKSAVLAELEKGGSVRAIAERLHITVAILKKAKDTFNKGLSKEDPRYINLRKKPTSEVIEFIDDTEEKVTASLVERTTQLTSRNNVGTDDLVSASSTISMLE